ncbi:MAG: hypothetical protein MUF83_01610 [Acidimicrobiales bacterium]|jgi:nitrogen regulatory protein PII|nr:hypothetical protein [Acidimicrobiales bacterium]
MSQSGLTPMTKIEVVVSGDDVAAVTATLQACGASGYTVLAASSGFGHGGVQQGRLLFNDHDALRMVLCVVPDDRTDAVVSALRRHFEDRSGVFFVSPTSVSRPEYFT